MPGEPRPCVLDTSALLCLQLDESGASQVVEVLEKLGPSRRVFASFISYMEFFYVVSQRKGDDAARKAYAELRLLPIQVVESDEQLGLAAARIKATTKLSLGDAWVAATAERLGAQLLHKDPEFEPLEGKISLRALPYKRG